MWERLDPISRSTKQEPQVFIGLDCPVTFQWINCEAIPLQPEENLVNLWKMARVRTNWKDTDIIYDALNIGQIWEQWVHNRLKKIWAIGDAHWQSLIFVQTIRGADNT